MDTDNYQQAWQAQSSLMHVSINTDLLRQVVQRDQRTFQAVIFWQDCLAAGIALLVLPVWFALGTIWSLPWTWYLAVPALVWVAGFILVDRIRHRRGPSKSGESLLSSLKRSRAQVEHQIWLLRNIFWWYLLPCAISLPVFLAQVVWLRSQSGWKPLGSALFVAVLYAAIYVINRFVVRSQLEPRRQELTTLLASLRDDIQMRSPAVTRNSPHAKQAREVWQPFVLASFCSAAITCLVLAGGLFDSGGDAVSRNSGATSSSLEELFIDLR